MEKSIEKVSDNYMEYNNVFNNPNYYRKKLLDTDLFIKSKRKRLDGKSLICVFFTSYCGVGCPFCFFHSPNYQKNNNKFINRENHFSKAAINKFIRFANAANVGYLQISGGGEPFLEFDSILKCVEKIKAERIILVTSGSWAYTKVQAESYLEKLYDSLLKNDCNPRLTIRLSISSYHSIKLKEKPFVNLLSLFEKKYSNTKNFTLQLKFFENDDILEHYLRKYFSDYKLSLIDKNGTDDDKYIKIMPWKYKLILKSGYEVILGKSRVFYSNMRPNINDKKSLLKRKRVFEIDLKLSQNDFASIVKNHDGKEGIDWIVEYNGNVCGWQNRVQDNLLNIYEDDYNTIYNSTINDLLTYSYIDKGSKYRESIINEVSPKTVLLAKTVNIRDYVGTILFADEKIRLYYNIRVIQDYLLENKINLLNLNKLPKELLDVIYLDKKTIKSLYLDSKYSVLDQELNAPISIDTFHDFLELIKLGHFELNKNQIKKAIETYNTIVDNNKIKSLDDISLAEGVSVERRLTKRMMTRKIIKKEKKNMTYYLFRHGETTWNVKNRIKGQMEDLKTKFTIKGNSQIARIKNQIINKHIEAIFTSDLYRTIETTRLINKDIGLPIYYYKNFRGLNMGCFQGKSMSKFLNDPIIKQSFIDYNIKIPGGESINDLNNRYLYGLDKVREIHNYSKVAIISHGAAISNIKSKISGDKYEDIDYCVIKYYNNQYKVIKYGKYN